MTVTRITGCLTLVAALGLWTGCGNSSQSDVNKKPAPANGEHHEGDRHDHKKGDGDSAEHAHAEEGPHHGHLIELGKEEYHAELTHDESSKTVTVYLLDGAAKEAVAIADPTITLNLVVDGKPQQAKLAAAPQESDAAGESSRFTITDEAVLEALEAPKTTGRLNVTIKGKAYVGNVEHHEHGEHKDK